MKRYRKGQYGYRDYHKKVEMGKVLFGAAMIILQLGARSLVTGAAYKNVLTVMAILTVLPTANAASPLLAAWRIKTPSKDFFQKLSVYSGRFPILYDLILTSKEAVMPVDAAVFHPVGVFLYCTAPKVDTVKMEGFLKEMMGRRQLRQELKVITDEKAFLRRLESLKEAEDYDGSQGARITMQLFENLSM